MNQLTAAKNISFVDLKDRHLKDFKNFFDRVKLDLGKSPKDLPTDSQLGA
ncbi:MAG: hypothetical protein ACI97P_002474 [Arcticibacterium sp.]|jgi:hypothetical protein